MGPYERPPLYQKPQDALQAHSRADPPGHFQAPLPTPSTHDDIDYFFFLPFLPFFPFFPFLPEAASFKRCFSINHTDPTLRRVNCEPFHPMFSLP